MIAGVDEAGRGPLAGPVVAAAVILHEDLKLKGIRDSKKIPGKEREELYQALLSDASEIGIGIVDSEEIDRINILNAAKQAMHKAIEGIKKNRPDIILIDALHIPSIKYKQMPIIKGDAKSACIAAASIIAKVTRDRIMMEFHEAYPHYGFNKHKGYATESHFDKIREFGPCPIHRKSFNKVMDLALF